MPSFEAGESRGLRPYTFWRLSTLDASFPTGSVQRAAYVRAS